METLRRGQPRVPYVYLVLRNPMLAGCTMQLRVEGGRASEYENTSRWKNGRRPRVQCLENQSYIKHQSTNIFSGCSASG